MERNITEVVKCRICGEKTTFTGTKLCDNCWEVIRKIKVMLRTEGGRELVAAVLKEAYKNLPETQ